MHYSANSKALKLIPGGGGGGGGGTGWFPTHPNQVKDEAGEEGSDFSWLVLWEHVLENQLSQQDLLGVYLARHTTFHLHSTPGTHKPHCTQNL